jgi:hypothetical protein
MIDLVQAYILALTIAVISFSIGLSLSILVTWYLDKIKKKLASLQPKVEGEEK